MIERQPSKGQSRYRITISGFDPVKIETRNLLPDNSLEFICVYQRPSAVRKNIVHRNQPRMNADKRGFYSGTIPNNAKGNR
jgi:hypothetical protein